MKECQIHLRSYPKFDVTANDLASISLIHVISYKGQGYVQPLSLLPINRAVKLTQNILECMFQGSGSIWRELPEISTPFAAYPFYALGHLCRVLMLGNIWLRNWVRHLHLHVRKRTHVVTAQAVTLWVSWQSKWDRVSQQIGMYFTYGPFSKCGSDRSRLCERIMLFRTSERMLSGA